MIRNLVRNSAARSSLRGKVEPIYGAVSSVQYVNLSPDLYSRHYSITRPQNSLILGGLGVAGVSVLAKYGVDAYNALQKEKKEQAAQVAAEGGKTDDEANSTAKTSEGQNAQTATEKKKEKKKTPEEATNPFSNFFNIFGKNYYEGGFEDKMSKREAALILGVRESATVDRIKECHRRILLNNHPDRGGSAYLATKVNEAKDFLMKTKSGNN